MISLYLHRFLFLFNIWSLQGDLQARPSVLINILKTVLNPFLSTNLGDTNSDAVA